MCLAEPQIKAHIIQALNATGTETFPPMSTNLARRIAADISASAVMSTALVSSADQATMRNFVETLFSTETGQDTVLAFIADNAIEPWPTVQCVEAALRTKDTQLYFASLIPKVDNTVFTNAVISEMMMSPAFFSLLVQKIRADSRFQSELIKDRPYLHQLLKLLKDNDLLPRPSVTTRNVERMLGIAEMRDFSIQYLQDNKYLPAAIDYASDTATADKMLLPGAMREYIIGKLDISPKTNVNTDDEETVKPVPEAQAESAFAKEYKLKMTKPVVVTVTEATRKVTSFPRSPEQIFFRFDPNCPFPPFAIHAVDCIEAAKLSVVNTPSYQLVAQNIITYGTFSHKVTVPASKKTVVSATPFSSKPFSSDPSNKRKAPTNQPDDPIKKFKQSISEGALPIEEQEDPANVTQDDEEENICCEYIKKLHEVITARSSNKSTASIAAKLSASRLVADESVPASADSFLRCILRFFPHYSSVGHLREIMCDYIETESRFVQVWGKETINNITRLSPFLTSSILNIFKNLYHFSKLST